MVYVPAGPSKRISFVNGAVTTHDIPSMPAFYIDKYEVSVGTYTRFVEASNYQTEFEKHPLENFPKVSWRDPLPGNLTQTGEFAVTALVWQDAEAYCEWAGLQLPTSDQWQKAALWDNNLKELRVFPWGNQPLESQGKVFGPGIPAPPPPSDANGNGPGGEYPYEGPVSCCSNDVSFFGVRNMAGNVSEWCDGYVWHGGSWFRGTGFPPAIAGDQVEVKMFPATIGFRGVISAP
jgi:formylglycine-generating enzyme required for sulfatase activity